MKARMLHMTKAWNQKPLCSANLRFGSDSMFGGMWPLSQCSSSPVHMPTSPLQRSLKGGPRFCHNLMSGGFLLSTGATRQTTKKRGATEASASTRTTEATSTAGSARAPAETSANGGGALGHCTAGRLGAVGVTRNFALLRQRLACTGNAGSPWHASAQVNPPAEAALEHSSHWVSLPVQQPFAPRPFVSTFPVHRQYPYAPFPAGWSQAARSNLQSGGGPPKWAPSLGSQVRLLRSTDLSLKAKTRFLSFFGSQTSAMKQPMGPARVFTLFLTPRSPSLPNSLRNCLPALEHSSMPVILLNWPEHWPPVAAS
mmetsp:Transcript_6279/g.17105  ORF Transcript_6279/g.17105 Transcript_6279/m.17105 type:complete len:313 (-) Transcript_6279:175-1113(-)